MRYFRDSSKQSAEGAPRGGRSRRTCEGVRAWMGGREFWYHKYDRDTKIFFQLQHTAQLFVDDSPTCPRRDLARVSLLLWHFAHWDTAAATACAVV